MTAAASAQTLVSLQTDATHPGTLSLSSFPLGSFRWSGHVHGITANPGTDEVIINVPTFSGHFIFCHVGIGASTFSCADSYGGSSAPSLPLNGATDIRFVVTRWWDATYAQYRIDMWNGDCTGYQWGVEAHNYNGSEPATVSTTMSLGGTSTAIAFFRSEAFPAGGISDNPTCPADAPTTIAPNVDFRFEGNSLTDSSSHHYVMTATGSSFVNTPTFNPAVIITSSATAPRPVFPLAPFTLTSNSITMNSAANGNVPTSFTWTQTAGAAAAIISPNSASTIITPSASCSCTFQLQVSDGTNTSTGTFNVGVVASNASGVMTQSNAELDFIVGPLARYGAAPWSWHDATEATNVDVLKPYWQAPPAPATLFTGTGRSDVFFSGYGPFTGLITDSYMVVIAANGASFCWQKNGGACSANIPISSTRCYGAPNALMMLTDGVRVCFGATSGYTPGDTFTRMPPLEGTASVSATSPNVTDPSTGQVCGGTPCFSFAITVKGTGTHWQTGTATQKVCAGARYWLIGDFVGDGQSLGRFFTTANTVVDDTTLQINANAQFWPIPAARSSGMLLQQVDSGCGAAQGSVDFGLEYGVPSGSNVSSSLFYYDGAPLGVVRLALASNLQTHIDAAKAACMNTWDYLMGQGYNAPTPRNASWQGAAACASWLGYTNWWGKRVTTTPGAGLGYYTTYALNSGQFSSPVTRDDQSGLYDIREDTYITRISAIFAHVFPAHVASPSTERTFWCNTVRNEVNNFWLLPWVGSQGRYTQIAGSNGNDVYWQENFFNTFSPAAGTPAGPLSTTVMGTSPWRDSGLTVDALAPVYDVLSNPSDCNTDSGVLAASVQDAAIRGAAYIWDRARTPDGGLAYNSDYQSQGQGGEPSTGVIPIDQADANTGGCVTVVGTAVTFIGGCSNNPGIVNDPGTNLPSGMFTKRFGPCDGTTKVRINGTNVAVNACADNNHMTLASGPGNGTYANWTSPSTVSVGTGSPTVTTSSDINVQSVWACNNTDFISIRGNTPVDNLTFKVASCPTIHTITLGANWSGASVVNQNEFSWSAAASTSCSPSIAGSTCEPDFYSGKSLAHDWAVALGKAFSWLGTNLWLNRLEYAAGSTWGGPAAGPAFLGPNSGPQSTLAPSNFMDPIPSCVTMATVQPCVHGGSGDALTDSRQAKAFGMSAGAGNARNAIAYYLTSPVAISTAGVSSGSSVSSSSTVKN